jgi:uncharacterized lipoprotein YajG
MNTLPAPLLCAVALLLATGCAHVPRTSITFNPKTHEITIQSPKEIELTNLTATIAPDGSATVKVESYRSRNSVEVIQAIAQQNNEMVKAIGDIGAKVVGEAVSKLK